MKTKENAAALAVFSSRTVTRRARGGRSMNGGVFAPRHVHPSYTHMCGLRPDGDALGRTASSCLANFEWISAVSFRTVKDGVSLSVRGIVAPTTLHSLIRWTS